MPRLRPNEWNFTSNAAATINQILDRPDHRLSEDGLRGLAQDKIDAIRQIAHA
jgi:hypothetical protein